MFQNLLELIDLDIDEVDNILLDGQGQLPLGNSINCSKLSTLKPVEGTPTSLPGKNYNNISRGMHEAIGIKLDMKNRHIYTTDLVVPYTSLI